MDGLANEWSAIRMDGRTNTTKFSLRLKQFQTDRKMDILRKEETVAHDDVPKVVIWNVWSAQSKKAREVNEINGDRTNIQPIFDQYVNQPINGRKNKLYVQLTCYLDDQQINWLTYEVAKWSTNQQIDQKDSKRLTNNLVDWPTITTVACSTCINSF